MNKSLADWAEEDDTHICIVPRVSWSVIIFQRWPTSLQLIPPKLKTTLNYCTSCSQGDTMNHETLISPNRCCVVSSWEINLTIWTHRPAMTRTKNKRSSQTLLSRSPLRHRSRPFSTKNKPTLENKHRTLRHASAQRIMKINYACVQLEETQSIIQNQYSLWVSARWGGWREAPALPLWSKAGLRRSAFLASQKLVSAFCATWINRGRPSLAAQ